MLQQITKPVGMKLSDWKLTRTNAETIKDQHFTGQPWSTKLFIGSKSFYKMITDENGQLLISDKATLKFAKNKDIENWFSRGSVWFTIVRIPKYLSICGWPSDKRPTIMCSVRVFYFYFIYECLST